MGAERFNISSVNPNEQIGGGGCVCSETKCTDCTGPYAIFYGTEMDGRLSPHVVLSLSCAERFIERARTEDALQAGEPDVIDAVAEEIPAADPQVPRHENDPVPADRVLDPYADVPEL